MCHRKLIVSKTQGNLTGCPCWIVIKPFFEHIIYFDNHTLIAVSFFLLTWEKMEKKWDARSTKNPTKLYLV